VQLGVMDGVTADPAAASSLDNDGLIRGLGLAVACGDGIESVANGGRIVGEVDLGGGGDAYTAEAGGRLHGVLTLGAGDDLVAVELGGGKLKIADFSAGEGSDDRIDLTAFGLADFDAVMAHAGQRAAGVVIDLGGHDQLFLQGLEMGDLSSGDFVL
jgi:hypothetical protein